MAQDILAQGLNHLRCFCRGVVRATFDRTSMSGPWQSWKSAGSSALQHGTSSKEEWAQWQCSHCKTHNWAHYGAQKKNCRTCGIKRSYKDAAILAVQSSYPQHRNSVQVKLDEVAVQLQQVVKKDLVAQPFETVAAEHGGKKNISEEIKSLETALAALPEDASLQSVRTELTTKIVEKKQVILRSKPIGA